MSGESNRDLICNGELEIINITPGIHDEVFEFFKANLMKNGNVNIACEMLSSELAIAEVEAVVRGVMKDGFGYAVRNCATKELVAICINSLQEAKTDALEAFQFQSPNVICSLEFMYRMKKSFDLYEQWNIECLAEIEFLSTREDYGGHGLAGILSRRTVEFVRRMQKGNLEAKDKDLLLPAGIVKLKPQAVCAIFTSIYTQKIGEKLSMETLVKIPFTAFIFEGKSFAEKINPIHKFATFAALKLE